MSLSMIIAAGGTGSRMKLDGSKQLAPLAGKPVLAHTLAVFDGHEAVSEIVIAIDAADVERCRAEIVERYGFAKVTAVVAGGRTRSASVKNAMAALSGGVDYVGVHDGARPLFPADLLASSMEELRGEVDGVVFGVPVTDTIKEAGSGGIVYRTLERANLWAAQTPQLFKRGVLEQAYAQPEATLAAATDDASLVELAGGRVKMIMGSEQNIKLTTRTDLLTAEAIMKKPA